MNPHLTRLVELTSANQAREALIEDLSLRAIANHDTNADFLVSQLRQEQIKDAEEYERILRVRLNVQ